VLFEEAPLPSSVWRRLRERENQLVSRVGQLLQVHPEARIRKPDVASYVVVHKVDSVVHSFVLHPPKHVDARVLTDEVVSMLSRYLARERSA
jgi:hypothetical protein